MKRTFIHSSIFDSEWKMQKYSDMLLRDIQEELSKNPTCGDIIQSTNGIRKARFALLEVEKVEVFAYFT